MFFIKMRLRHLSNAAAPSAAFKRELRGALVGYGVPGYRLFLKPVAVTVAVAVFLLSSTGAYAYYSDTVLPNHPLYGVRLATEKIEKVVAFGPMQVAKVAEKHLERRVEEMEVLKEDGAFVTEKDVERVTEAVVIAIEAGDAIPDEDVAVYDERVQEKEARVVVALQGVASSTDSEEKRERILNKIIDGVETCNKTISELKTTRADHFRRFKERYAAVLSHSYQNRIADRTEEPYNILGYGKITTSTGAGEPIEDSVTTETGEGSTTTTYTYSSSTSTSTSEVVEDPTEDDATTSTRKEGISEPVTDEDVHSDEDLAVDTNEERSDRPSSAGWSWTGWNSNFWSKAYQERVIQGYRDSFKRFER